ncbi:hypothetical protein LPB85_01875 [Chryseobacterium sp. LC2016-27]|uniref:hypothetical protein n=1 Tax=Chryseobacterium sp. LC2016-27 TaxID=2897326 RepID=UPI001E35EEDB|nr:hypothetical protein [Chryseobacterium sp. LC2016-27]MCD0454192.1 hypothetical protein [Chryseobacterium sp. LC2016-27]
MKSKEELKKLFENGDKPTQENFWEWQDSYWHKDEKLPTENTGIYKIKGSVPDLTALHLMNSMSEGDVYNLLDTGDNYVYVLDLNNTREAGWDKLGGSFIGNFIPLTGTETGEKVTGNIEVASSVKLYKLKDIPNEEFIESSVMLASGGVILEADTSDQNGKFYVTPYTANFEFLDSNNQASQIVVSGNGGLSSPKDFTNIGDPLSFAQKKYVDEKTKPTLQTVVNNGLINPSTFTAAYSEDMSSYIDINPNSQFSSYFLNGNSTSTINQGLDWIIFQRQFNPDGRATTVKLEESGFQYDEDYSKRSGFGARSLVDKGYVDSKPSNATLQSVLDSNPIANSLDLKSSITLNPNAMVFNKFATASTFSQFMQMSETLELMRGFNDTTTTRVYVDKGGFKYGEDYSQRPEFNDRSLVDKAYVDSNTQPDTLQTVLDNNGYAISPDGDSTVIMDLNSNQFTSIQKSDNLRTSIAQFSSSINLDSANTLGSSRIVLGGPQISIGTERGIETVNLTLTADNALEYTNDYSSKYTDRTLVDRGYVKSKYINLEGYDSSDNVTIGKQLYFANFNFNSDPATNPNQYFSWIGERGFRYEKGINDGVMDSVASEISEDQFYYSLKKSQPGTRGGSVIVAGVNSLSLSCGKSETGGANPKEGMIQIHDTGRIEIRTEVDAGISLRGLELTTNDSYPVVVIDPITGKLYYRML